MANASSYFAGQSDAPLSERGRRQAEALGLAFSRVPLDALYASDLKRAHDTAEAVGRGRRLDVELEPGLRERHMGVLAGMSFDEARERHPELWKKLLARDPHAAPPGGESHVELAERVRKTLEAIVARHRGQALALVAHGGTIAHAVRLLLGVDDFALPFWVAADNAGVTRVDHVEPAEGVLLPRLAYANRIAAAEGDAFLRPCTPKAPVLSLWPTVGVDKVQSDAMGSSYAIARGGPREAGRRAFGVELGEMAPLLEREAAKLGLVVRRPPSEAWCPPGESVVWQCSDGAAPPREFDLVVTNLGPSTALALRARAPSVAGAGAPFALLDSPARRHAFSLLAGALNSGLLAVGLSRGLPGPNAPLVTVAQVGVAIVALALSVFTLWGLAALWARLGAARAAARASRFRDAAGAELFDALDRSLVRAGPYR